MRLGENGAGTIQKEQKNWEKAPTKITVSRGSDASKNGVPKTKTQ